MAKKVIIMHMNSHKILSKINTFSSKIYLIPCRVVFEAKSDTVFFPDRMGPGRIFWDILNFYK